MALTPIEHELFKLQKFKKNQINHMQNGVRLAGLAGVPLEDLLRQASSARLKLAKRFLRSSRHLMSHRPVLYRDVVSRAYYSIYHSARAVSFLSHPGDDYEEHDKVATGLPPDLPDVEVWRNKIKDARLKRNEADYEPFMVSDPQFKRASATVLSTANDFIVVCSTYLRSEGCNV
ncbi:HEPN domain-containing protein [Bradyrhizobium japonicum]|uniref:HEPN domain-containing protein n=1 Tax=Bradyrhizobium japonicum TaxID=375 RepID=UPI001B8A5EE5|nr:HEPN domain-containing protein [Bradyrhizobium japonicum]MBR0969608.1 HEPN domain-containing protein [Bradyrhizobium japonicum]